MSARAELEVPFQKGPEQATGVKIIISSRDYCTYIQHKLDMSEAVELLNALAECVAVHHAAVAAAMAQAAQALKGAKANGHEEEVAAG